MNQQQIQEFVLEQNTPFEELDCSEAFENLTETEKKYLHYYTKVSFQVFVQYLDVIYVDVIDNLLITKRFLLSGLMVWFIDLVHTNLTGIATAFLFVPSNIHCPNC